METLDNGEEIELFQCKKCGKLYLDMEECQNHLTYHKGLLWNIINRFLPRTSYLLDNTQVVVCVKDRDYTLGEKVNE